MQDSQLLKTTGVMAKYKYRTTVTVSGEQEPSNSSTFISRASIR